jgi:DNA repair protein RecN (Recombination protein N)
MLTRLVIRDYLLVRRLELDFHPGLTVLTGETGAGKSMIAGALDVLLGERFPKDAFVDDAEKSVIEGYFLPTDARPIYELAGDSDVEQTSEILLRREISRHGRTRSMLNDRPIPQDLLTKLRGMLADFHGQREHQSLFDAGTQLEYLDVFASSLALAVEVRELYEQWSAHERELERAEAKLNEYQKHRALLLYQLEEISRLGLKSGEEETIEARLNKLESAEKIAVEAARLGDLLADADSSMTSLSGKARFAAVAISRIDPEFSTLASEFSNLESQIKELSLLVRNYQDSLQFDPAELETLRERRGAIWKLKRKHGLTVEEILKRAEDLKILVDRGEELERDVDKFREQEEATRKLLAEKAVQLSKRRRTAAAEFSLAVVAAMKPLGFAAPRFEAGIESLPEPYEAAQLTENGGDRVQFMFSANPGTKLAPLAAVASGGESSRVTLAIKSVLASRIAYPMMIYDEIDLGISGKVADRVGTALSGLAQHHQVLVITHLPQIASCADHHLLVTKQTERGKTYTSVRYLNPEERVEAVASLIAGVNITDKALASASELLRQSGKITNPV